MARTSLLSPFSRCTGIASLLAFLAWQLTPVLERRFAPVTEFACPVPGTTFTWSIFAAGSDRLNRWRSVGQLGRDCAVQSDSWGNYTWAGALAGDRQKTDAVIEMAHAIWPLQVGKHLERTEPADDEPGEQHVALDVVRYEPVHVQAGWFWAYEVRRTYRTNSRVWYYQVWYAPSLHWIVDQRSLTLQGEESGIRNPYQLVAVHDALAKGP